MCTLIPRSLGLLNESNGLLRKLAAAPRVVSTISSAAGGRGSSGCSVQASAFTAGAPGKDEEGKPSTP